MYSNTKEMSGNQISILGNLVFNFCNEFIGEVSSIIAILNRIGLKDIESSLPNTLKSKSNISITCYFSIDKKQMFISFNQDKNTKFEFVPIYGEPIPFNIFKIGLNETDTGMITFNNLTLQRGKAKLNIEYGFATTLSGFSEMASNVPEFTIDLINANRDLYKYKDKGDKLGYLNYLKELKQEMLIMFSNEDTPELTIDKFLEVHPVVLQRGLHLDQLQHQVILKNVLEKYEHDLKPDLIAYDTLNKKWVIVDYKKAKKNIIKNINKVRTGFKSSVNDLENQLNDYLEYFEEEEQRSYVRKTYKIDIKYPDAIGIIGNVNLEERDAFNRLMQNKPRWLNIMPYNYLYDGFCNYIKIIEGNINN